MRNFSKSAWKHFIAVALLGFSQLACAQSLWTWNNATHPAGVGGVPGGASGAGVWVYKGVYYIPGVGHMASPLGAWRIESVTGQGNFGRVAHTTRPTNTETGDDIGLIATGTQPIAPRIRVSDGWQDAPISDVSHGDLKKGDWICHSGMSADTRSSGGYRCGTMTMDCPRTASMCYAAAASGNLVAGGDSSGPVWWYDGRGGVVLMGWVRGSLMIDSKQWLSFSPVWLIQDHVWKPEESWVSWGYPAGNDGTGCFLTTSGCIKP
ncbi:hypothetical protein [Caballeronia sp. BR00000012568055]|uniref:hypothetical protein n=1 Tax=Caballeronia sp. BR00000012568055 TaxID=2918761 RepID=UPI0023F7EC77|nr:hypothetical protein [Caballeronia sp. BR00000012568055]